MKLLLSNIWRSKFSTSCLRYKENDYFITTPIFYVNASPHIGHLYSAVIADAICRFQKLLGKETLFTTGTDEHGTKIQEAASIREMPLLQYCNNIAQSYKDLFKKFDVDCSTFIRTTEGRHHNAVSNFWDLLKSHGYIYSGTYSGWYCIQDETFLTELQIKNGPNNSKVSSESGHPVAWTEEENFMFKLSQLKDDLLYWLKDRKVVQPDVFHQILVRWVSEEELVHDISISRPSSRVHWGIPVPNCPGQTVYVWLDALVSYLTVCGYPDVSFAGYWPADVQVIGKDILKFHGIYWPAFLIAAGLEPPRRLFCHSHWTVNGEKMSKSRGNVVDPIDRMERYTSSGLRYFLLREGVAHSDGNFSDEKVIRILNSELADTLGNLLSRCCGGAINPKQVFPKFQDHLIDLHTPESQQLKVLLKSLPDDCELHFKNCDFYKGVDFIMATLRAANKFFEAEKPWVLIKKDLERHECVLYLTMETLRVCGILLQPIVPKLAEVMLNHLGVPVSNRSWAHSKSFKSNGSSLNNEKIILQPKIDRSTQVQFNTNLHSNKSIYKNMSGSSSKQNV